VDEGTALRVGACQINPRSQRLTGSIESAGAADFAISVRI